MLSQPKAQPNPNPKRKYTGGHDGRTDPTTGRFVPMTKKEDVIVPEKINGKQFTVDDDGNIQLDRYQLMYDSFAYFMSELKDDRDELLIVTEHHELWCDLMQQEHRLCLLAPRDHGKRLALDTPIATPQGWSTMGDLTEGDEVFDERGKVCHVTEAHPISLGDSYVVTFDDGSTIKADAEHLWLTWTKRDRSVEFGKRARLAGRSGHDSHHPRSSDGPSVKTTAEILKTLKAGKEWNHSVPCSLPLDLPEVSLPISPHTLGAWLGDGTSSAASITSADEELLENLSNDGYGTQLQPSSVHPDNKSSSYRLGPLNSRGVIIHGEMRRRLRALNVLNNKHIPLMYLRASEPQRRALLAGLMNTDGYAHPDGTVEFCNTNAQLAQDVLELALSLGFKARMYEGRSVLNGVDHGPKWRICWSPRVPVFRLARKAAVLRTDKAQEFRTSHRRIVAVEKIDDVQMRCITVDSPSHLYLAGKQLIPTHNTYTVLSYLMWRCWKHNRTREGALKTSRSDGTFQAILFSDTHGQAGEFFQKLQMLVLANEELFSDILPTGARGSGPKIREIWTGGRIRFRNGAEVATRAFLTSARGLHPQLIVCDDVLSDDNSSTSYQRARIWKYFVGTISPMLGPKGQLIIIGTAQHYSDLLHRLKTVAEFRKGWRKFKAVDWDTGKVLWPARHDLEDLKAKQRMDAVLFAKEYQNEPRDEASSLFPMKMTSMAIQAGAGLTFVDNYEKRQGEFVVLAADFAMSESIGADYCVVQVARVDITTQKRQLLWAVRERGWTFQTQVNALRFACLAFNVDLGVVENNSFQRWVRTEAERYPETAGRIIGHQTGNEKVSVKDGVPLLTIPLNQRLWIIPSGVDDTTGQVIDPRARDFAMVWQAEMNSFGWVNDKLQGAGEHDDTVMSFWLLERSVRILNQLLQTGPTEMYVTMNEIGIDRVPIGSDW